LHNQGHRNSLRSHLSPGDEGTARTYPLLRGKHNCIPARNLDRKTSCTQKHNRCTTTMKVIRIRWKEGWDILSEDCSDSGSNAAPPPKRERHYARGNRTKTTVFTLRVKRDGYSSRSYSYNRSEGQELSKYSRLGSMCKIASRYS